MAARSIVFLTLLLVWSVSSAWAQGSEVVPIRTSSAQLKEIQAQVAKETLQLEKIASKIAGFEHDAARLEGELKTIRKEDAKLEQDRERNAQRIDELSQDLERLEEQRAEIASLVGKRLGALYVSRRANAWEFLISNQRPKDWSRIALYLSRVSEFDRRLIADLERVQARVEADRLERQDRLEQDKVLRERLVKQRRLLADQASKVRSAVAKLNQQQAARKKTIGALQAQAVRLEAVMASLTGGVAHRRAQKPASITPAPGAHAAPFEGAGLFRKKGSLSLPVEGVVVTQFGKRKHRQFRDIVFKKGIEFRTEAGGRVFAIAAGRVMFAGRMPGYGGVVILDHGGRYYSLYSRLVESLVSRGQVVDRNDVLGKVGEPDSRGRNFYFEIRQGGTPVNPQKYYHQKFRVSG